MLKHTDGSSNRTSLTLPASTTYRIPGIVTDVSATLVAMIHSRVPSGGSSNTRICASVGSKEYRGRTWSGASSEMKKSLNRSYE